MKQILKSCTALTLSVGPPHPRLAQEPLKELVRAKVRSRSSPGRAISSAARPTRATIGSTDFEKNGLQGQRQDAATSDEMVALMNEGGFDL